MLEEDKKHSWHEIVTLLAHPAPIMRRTWLWIGYTRSYTWNGLSQQCIGLL